MLARKVAAVDRQGMGGGTLLREPRCATTNLSLQAGNYEELWGKCESFSATPPIYLHVSLLPLRSADEAGLTFFKESCHAFGVVGTAH